MKKCCGCKQFLPPEKFNKNKSEKDGLNCYCKICHRIKAKEDWHKHITKRHIQQKKHYSQNKDIIIKKNKIYYKKNRKKIIKREKNKYKINRLEKIQQGVQRANKNYASWIPYLPLQTNCQICGRIVYFHSNSGFIGREQTIHFDHKKFHINIHNPKQWLASHYFNEKNKQIWEKENLGHLCAHCNRRLRTLGRKKWIKQLVGYAFGENYEIKKCFK